MPEADAHNIINAAPVLLVNDIHKAVAFYTKKLGFVVDRLYGEPPSFAMVNAGNTTIMLKQSTGGPRPNAQSLSGMWDVYLWVRDLNAVETMLSSNNVPITRGPEKTPYDCTEIEINDPDGHVVAFGYCP